MEKVLKNNWLVQLYIKSLPILYVVDTQGEITNYSCPKTMLNETIPMVFIYNEADNTYESRLLPYLVPNGLKFWSIDERRAKDVSTIIKQKNTTQQQLTKANKDCESTQIALQSKLAECDSLTSELASISTELQTVTEKNKSLDKFVKSQNEKITSIGEELDMIIKQKIELSQQNTAYGNQVAELELSINQLLSDKTAIEEQLKGKCEYYESEIANYKKQCQTLQNTYNATIKDAKGMQDKLDALSKENKELSSRVASMTASIKKIIVEDK